MIVSGNNSIYSEEEMGETINHALEIYFCISEQTQNQPTWWNPLRHNGSEDVDAYLSLSEQVDGISTMMPVVFVHECDDVE